MVRLVLNKLFNDQTSTETLLEKTGFLSINQMNAQIKLVEVWKSQKIDNHPLTFNKIEHSAGTRNEKNGHLQETGKTNLTIKSFYGDASRLWNKCPITLKDSKSVHTAKKAIINFVKTLPPV
jgi:hypothetical protein